MQYFELALAGALFSVIGVLLVVFRRVAYRIAVDAQKSTFGRATTRWSQNGPASFAVIGGVFACVGVFVLVVAIIGVVRQ